MRRKLFSPHLPASCRSTAIIVGLLFIGASFAFSAGASIRTAGAGIYEEVSGESLSRLPRQAEAPCPTCPPKKRQVIYAPLFDLPEVAESEIVFNCRSGGEIAITPTFYTLDGTPYVGEDVRLKPAEIRFVNTKSLIPARERNRHRWGAIAFTYEGGFMEAWAQLTLHGVRGGGSTNVLFTVLGQPRSNTTEAAWWVPRGGTALVALGNSSDQPIHANLTFSNWETRQVELPPFATEIVRFRPGTHQQLSSDRGEGVSISYTGPAGSLIPTGFTSTPDGKFVGLIRFYDPRNVVQPNLYANGLRLKNAAPHMILRNTSPEPITVRPRLLTASGDPSAAVELTELRLSPYVVTEVDLAPLMKAAARSVDLESVSVQVLNSGPAASLVGALYSKNKKTGVFYEVPLRDSGPPRASTGGYPIRLDGDYTTLLSVTNTGDAPGGFTLQINYTGGNYVVGLVSLNAGETKTFDMRRIRDEQRPDVNGRPLPPELETAQAVWSVRGNGSVRLTGRAEVVSLRDGVSSSYSCYLCCPNSFAGGWITPMDATVAVGGSTNFIAWQRDYMCDVGMQSPYPVPASWYSSNEFIATIDHSYAAASGIQPGGTTITADWLAYSWQYDGLDEWCEPFVEPFTAYAGLTVLAPQVKIKLSGTDVTNQTRDVIVGQRVVLNAEVEPTETVYSNAQWSIPGTRVAGYNVTCAGPQREDHTIVCEEPTSAAVVPLTNVSDNTVTYYWVDGGEGREVTFSIVIGNETFSGKMTWNVKRPTASVAVTEGNIGLFQEGTNLRLKYGVPPPGITFAESITVPTGFSGTTQWVQLADITRRREIAPGAWERLEQDGLDTSYPYSIADSTEDSPDHLLDQTRYIRVTTDDTFRMYMMFRPHPADTSIWVPLRVVDWAWSAEAAYNGTLNEWSIPSSFVFPPIQADTTDFPQWTSNVINHLDWFPE